MLKKQTLIAFCPYDCVCVCMNIFFRWIERSFGRSFRNVLHQQHTISHHASRIRCGVHRFFSRFSFVCLLFFVICSIGYSIPIASKRPHVCIELFHCNIGFIHVILISYMKTYSLNLTFLRPSEFVTI